MGRPGLEYDYPLFPMTAHRDEITEQVRKILDSRIFSGSEMLCRLFSFLASCALDRPAQQVKEFQIATEALGRLGDFDPRLDSSVRVLAARLRSKLNQYYATEGTLDTILIELSKGSYALTFEQRSATTVSEVSLPAEPLPVEAARNPVPTGQAMPTPATSTGQLVRMGALVLLGMCLALPVALLAAREAREHAAAAPGAIDKDAASAVHLRQFWTPFLSSDAQPLSIFSNADFVGRPATGLRYFKPGIDAPGDSWGLYTGVGEVSAVHDLDLLFSRFHRSIRVKRQRLLTLDDAKVNNLIFLGAPIENTVLNDLPHLQEFTFETVASGARQGDVAIKNQHPGPNEAATYLRAADSPFVEDYFVISLMKGFDGEHWILLLSGSGTVGTQAAAEYVCDDLAVQQVLAAIGPNTNRPFEALFRATVRHGIPVHSDFIALHWRS